MIERPRSIIDTVQNDRDKSEGLPCLVAIPQRLSKQQVLQFQPLSRSTDTQPGEYGHRQCATWKLTNQFDRQISEIDLTSRKRVEASDFFVGIKQNSGDRKFFLLMLPRVCSEPVVDIRLATVEGRAGMSLLKWPKDKTVRERDRTHFPPRMIAPSRF